MCQTSCSIMSPSSSSITITALSILTIPKIDYMMCVLYKTCASHGRRYIDVYIMGGGDGEAIAIVIRPRPSAPHRTQKIRPVMK